MSKIAAYRRWIFGTTLGVACFLAFAQVCFAEKEFTGSACATSASCSSECIPYVFTDAFICKSVDPAKPNLCRAYSNGTNTITYKSCVKTNTPTAYCPVTGEGGTENCVGMDRWDCDCIGNTESCTCACSGTPDKRNIDVTIKWTCT